MAAPMINLRMQNQNECGFPSPSELREAIKTTLDVPVVFKNQIKSWSIPWTISDLTKKYGSTLLDFRMVPKSHKGVSWETQHEFEEATISDFISWQHDDIITSTITNPLSKYKKDQYWAYSSYNYMNVIFPEESDILQAINWSAFGFPEITGKESTFWFGSEGANTPCHFDSYGCNLVAQISGRKKWILFPPYDTAFLYPTRIPYEESSVFSSVNILNADLSQHPLFKKSHPHVVILEPGDVLFVPKKWWHFVLNLDSVTISINTWIKLESDSESRLEEGVTRALMSSLIPVYEPEGETWLNPKEELMPPDETLKYITATLQELHKVKQKVIGLDEGTVCSKVCKTSDETDVHSQTCKSNVCIRSSKYIVKVKSVPFDEGFTKRDQSSSVDTSATPDTSLIRILNTFVHPEVVSLICRLLKE